ncbi:Rhodanese-related sulfurtransferase [Mesobacillus persicus]|uniref:Rhodanese-related sulfurtransferase n=1 Tax=Mesobacillus persicus TaxID=930146 RepID=A0A1H8C2D4_9BACI|nr:rhodanese-like domain-containing protein [Mesobacillus persicus]SEM89223.1 Rhodanese-related sulfurtransferase [Mesobacillus persicus]
MKKYIIVFFAIFLLVGCTGVGSYQDVSVDEAKELIASGEVKVLDVRTDEEFSAGHIPGAQLIPLQVIDGKLSELDKNTKYLVVCRSGNRSAQASTLLAENGFENIYNMTGGMNEWTGEINY